MKKKIDKAKLVEGLTDLLWILVLVGLIGWGTFIFGLIFTVVCAFLQWSTGLAINMIIWSLPLIIAGMVSRAFLTRIENQQKGGDSEE